MAVVVTVTKPGVTITVTPTSSGAASSSLSAGAIAGIVVGVLVGGVSLTVLVLYLLSRHGRHKFTRVANPASAAGRAADLRRPPSTSSRWTKFLSWSSQKPSISTEPLMSPFTSVSRAHPPSIHADFIPSWKIDSPYNPYEFGQTGTASHSAAPVIPSIPPVGKLELTPLELGSSDTPPQPQQTSVDSVPSPPTTPTPQPKVFIHRMLQSRAQASAGVPPAHRSSIDLATTRSMTSDSWSLHADEERLLAEAERTALRDAETPHGDGGRKMLDEDDDWSVESVYSQPSAPVDHSVFFSDFVPRQQNSLTVPRQNSSRRQRTPAPTAELPPVAEVPDTPGALEGQSDTYHVSFAGNSSLDGRVSHGTVSRSMSSVIGQPGALPLLTSANFGKGSATPPGSISSAAGWGSRSSGSASRYPSLALSSVAPSSRSGPRSDAGTDWHHPPSGLAGLTSLQIGSMRNPHSPVEEQSKRPDVAHTRGSTDPAPVKRAHLRGGTAGSLPEVERRSMIQSGIAHIDVAL